MNKQEFLAALNKRLSALDAIEAEEHINFYSEMIDDRQEDGLSEEEAVAAVGTIDAIVEQIGAEKEDVGKAAQPSVVPKRRRKMWEIVLLAVGSPLWIVLLLAAAIVMLSLYVTVWSLIVSLWAVFAALVGTMVGCMAMGIALMIRQQFLPGIALVGAGIFAAGLSIFAFFGSKAATKGVILLTKTIICAVKNRLIKKEDAV